MINDRGSLATAFVELDTESVFSGQAHGHFLCLAGKRQCIRQGVKMMANSYADRERWAVIQCCLESASQRLGAIQNLVHWHKRKHVITAGINERTVLGCFDNSSHVPGERTQAL